MKTDRSTTELRYHWHLGRFVKPNTMPGGWNLSELPSSSQGQNSMEDKQNSGSTRGVAAEQPEIRFSEWQIDPYLDNLLAPDRRDLSAY